MKMSFKFKALSYAEENEDANYCRVVMGKMKRYSIGEIM